MYPYIPAHSCGMVIVVTLGLYHTRSLSGVSINIPWIAALNLLKSTHYSGLVNLSNIIYSIGQYFKYISPDVIWSLTNKYCTRICLDLLLLYAHALFYRRITLMLYWYMIASIMLKPFTSMIYIIHRSPGRTSYPPKILASMELLLLIFFHFGVLII